MSTHEREELLSKLSDANPALGTEKQLREYHNFWFDKKYVHAFNSGFGVRLELPSALNCGIPGKALLALLGTSSIKQVFLDTVGDHVVLQMGKAKVNLVPVTADKKVWWPFEKSKKEEKQEGKVTLTDGVLEALNQMRLFKGSKQTHTVHRGVMVEPRKSVLELYGTDSKGLAQITVDEKPTTGLPRFIIPWELIDLIRGLVEPGAELLVYPSFLMVDGDGVQLASSVLDSADAPDFSGRIKEYAEEASSDPIELPANLAPVLERAKVLAGGDEAVIDLSAKEGFLSLKGTYSLGNFDEKLPIKAKINVTANKYVAQHLSRALPSADGFTLTRSGLVLYGGDTFVYILASKS